MVQITKESGMQSAAIPFAWVEVQYPDKVQWDETGFYDMVEQHVAALREQDGIFKRLPVDLLVADRELRSRAAVQRIEKLTVAEEHRGFVLLRGNGIVDVRKAQRSGIFRTELKNPIREDPLDGNDILHTARDFICRSILLDGVVEGFNQASAPPALYCCPIKAPRTDSVDDMQAFAGRGFPSG